MVKSINTKYSFVGTSFSNVEFPSTIEVEEDDKFIYVSVLLDPWVKTTLTLDKLFCNNLDTAIEMFKMFVKRSYNFK